MRNILSMSLKQNSLNYRWLWSGVSLCFIRVQNESGTYESGTYKIVGEKYADFITYSLRQSDHQDYEYDIIKEDSPNRPILRRTHIWSAHTKLCNWASRRISPTVTWVTRCSLLCSNANQATGERMFIEVFCCVFSNLVISKHVFLIIFCILNYRPFKRSSEFEEISICTQPMVQCPIRDCCTNSNTVFSITSCGVTVFS